MLASLNWKAIKEKKVKSLASTVSIEKIETTAMVFGWNKKLKKYQSTQTYLERFPANLPETIDLEIHLRSDMEIQNATFQLQIYAKKVTVHKYDLNSKKFSPEQFKFTRKPIFTIVESHFIPEGQSTVKITRVPVKGLFPYSVEHTRHYALKFLVILKIEKRQITKKEIVLASPHNR